METIAHHTCEKKGSKDFIEKEAPFESIHNPNESKYQFLGTGYYLWDYNLDYAKIWGKRPPYSNKFYVVECELNIPDQDLLDLAGNRMDMAYFLEIPTILKEAGYDIEDIIPNGQDWYIGSYIEFLKKVAQESDEMAEIFPYVAVRAVDLSPYAEEQILVKFVKNKKNETNLNPRFVICLYKKNSLLLPRKEIVHES